MSRLVVASNAAEFALEHGIDFVDGRARVILELTPGSEPPTTVPLIVEARYEHLVQALVPPAELCQLASDPSVTLIRLPYPSAPNRSGGGA